jgi:hypothetical protein
MIEIQEQGFLHAKTRGDNCRLIGGGLAKSGAKDTTYIAKDPPPPFAN